MTLYPGMTHLMENTVLNVKNQSHSVTAELEIPEGGVTGVIVAQAGPSARSVRESICPLGPADTTTTSPCSLMT